MKKNFLFLQGVASEFFYQLGQSLRSRGHIIHRINFCGGDCWFWFDKNAIDYTGDLSGWGCFLEQKLAAWQITDIVLFGDCRPLHAIAIDNARHCGIRTHIFEEGYLRPNWLTLESQGINGFSSLPANIEDYLKLWSAVNTHSSPETVLVDEIKRSIDDVAYTLATMLLSRRYKEYQHYRPYKPLVEYASGARRLAYRAIKKARRAQCIHRLVTGGQPYFVWAMQIEVDSQISVHSQFETLDEAIELVLKSFADAAPADCILAITEHPRETSPRNWRRHILDRAEQYGLNGRVHYIVNGTPEYLLAKSRGLVVINSTIGQKALEIGVPVITLSPAIFNIAGLTFQKGLDQFWHGAAAADARIVQIYRQVLMAKCLVNGGVYSKQGIFLAVKNAVARIDEAVSMHEEKHSATDKNKKIKDVFTPFGEVLGQISTGY